MTTQATARLTGYAALAALALFAALALRRPELVAVAAPFALVLGLGLTRRPPDVRVGFTVAEERALEGDDVHGELVLRTDSGVDRLEVMLALPDGLELAGSELPHAVHLRPGEERVLPLRLRGRWGAWVVGDVRLRASDRFGVLAWETRVERPRALRILPGAAALRALVSPAETHTATGSEVARVRADGLEFADTRGFVPGDRMQAVNWRASARRGTLIVNERHPERNADVVIFLDSFSDAGAGDTGILAKAVRAAMAVAEPHLRRRDRVGLVSFGGTLRWLEPGSGAVQRYRLLDALLETQVFFSYAWKDVNVIPARTLPPKALVVAITPLLDPRAVSALLDLGARGFDLAVIEIPGDDHASRPDDPIDALAWRLWLLKREELRAKLLGMGIAVARWEDGEPLEVALEGVRTYRRHARLVRR